VDRKEILCCLALVAGNCFGAAVSLPGGSLPVPVTSPAGASFTYSGTLTQNDTISFTQVGTPCLQPGPAYCTNGAGVVVGAGSPGVGTANFVAVSGGGITGTFSLGSVVMVISGVGLQVFPVNAANGFGSSNPPTSLTLPATTLGALGFPPFSVANPTITFFLAAVNYGNNTGSLTLVQPAPPIVPAPGTLVLVLCGMLGSWLLVSRLRRLRRA
jgi:hypothetical protein